MLSYHSFKKCSWNTFNEVERFLGFLCVSRNFKQAPRAKAMSWLCSINVSTAPLIFNRANYQIEFLQESTGDVTQNFPFWMLTVPFARSPLQMRVEETSTNILKGAVRLLVILIGILYLFISSMHKLPSWSGFSRSIALTSSAAICITQDLVPEGRWMVWSCICWPAASSPSSHPWCTAEPKTTLSKLFALARSCPSLGCKAAPWPCVLGKARQQLAGPAQYPHKVSGPQEQGRGHSMALQAPDMWPHRKGKPYPNLGLSKKDKVSLCPPQYPIPSLQVRMTLGKKPARCSPCALSRGGAPVPSKLPRASLRNGRPLNLQQSTIWNVDPPRPHTVSPKLCNSYLPLPHVKFLFLMQHTIVNRLSQT